MGVIVAVLIIAFLVILVIGLILMLALFVTRRQRTYKVASSIEKQRKINIYTGVPSSLHSISSLGSISGETNPTFSQSPGNSKFTVDFKVADS